jgi:hypothetical protein
MLIFRLILVVLVAVTAGCHQAHSFITVTNQSSLSLSNLVISGACEERITNMLAARSEWVTVTPHWQERPIELSFTSDGKRYTTNSAYYIEGGTSYRIHFTIDSNLNVTADVKNEYQK